MKKLITYAILALLAIVSGCKEQGSVNLCSKNANASSCNSNNTGGNKGGQPINPNNTLNTAGIYRDTADDHVAVVSSNGRVLFWDDYYTDREVEQRGLVRISVQANTEYTEDSACQYPSGYLASHVYSFTPIQDKAVQFSTNCGDARFYTKRPSKQTLTMTTADNSGLYSAAGEYLEIADLTLINTDGMQATLADNGQLKFNHPYTDCEQEYLVDETSLVILSSPNCEATGFVSGFYQP
ncbi:hypothetical protein AHAT_09490 [Agarivorans sp. Toyoura001]|uniref:hypothetical protein n=1 Tax=Agarivorans sp. Toyoura001 TaxID=2283141 RepID=UPI0010E57FC8|nr:hypothetical protein [Agarivorans sp. Toyoura001]GDY25059.1 hypothetical protein AHAT_09490 [Agarivorans sp. Toyoura001]